MALRLVRGQDNDGSHQAAPADGGTADNGATSWIPTESWKFITQF